MGGVLNLIVTNVIKLSFKLFCTVIYFLFLSQGAKCNGKRRAIEHNNPGYTVVGLNLTISSSEEQAENSD